jgi:hypothetical protein
MTKAPIDRIEDELRQLIAGRLGVRARSFQRAVRRAGRQLPAPARNAAAELGALRARMAHPRLAARTDPSLIGQAAQRFRRSLAGYSPGARVGKARALLMAEIGFRMAVLIALGLAFLHWQTGA